MGPSVDQSSITTKFSKDWLRRQTERPSQTRTKFVSRIQKTSFYQHITIQKIYTSSVKKQQQSKSPHWTEKISPFFLTLSFFFFFNPVPYHVPYKERIWGASVKTLALDRVYFITEWRVISETALLHLTILLGNKKHLSVVWRKCLRFFLFDPWSTLVMAGVIHCPQTAPSDEL